MPLSYRDLETMRLYRGIFTDKPKCYGVVKQESLPGVEHRQHQGFNNRAKNCHLVAGVEVAAIAAGRL